jgi:hypothetical protein
VRHRVDTPESRQYTICVLQNIFRGSVCGQTSKLRIEHVADHNEIESDIEIVCSKKNNVLALQIKPMLGTTIYVIGGLTHPFDANYFRIGLIQPSH